MSQDSRFVTPNSDFFAMIIHHLKIVNVFRVILIVQYIAVNNSLETIIHNLPSPGQLEKDLAT